MSNFFSSVAALCGCFAVKPCGFLASMCCKAATAPGSLTRASHAASLPLAHCVRTLCESSARARACMRAVRDTQRATDRQRGAGVAWGVQSTGRPRPHRAASSWGCARAGDLGDERRLACEDA